MKANTSEPRKATLRGPERNEPVTILDTKGDQAHVRDRLGNEFWVLSDKLTIHGAAKARREEISRRPTLF